MRRLCGALVVLLVLTGCTVSRVGGRPVDGDDGESGPIELAEPIELARVLTVAPPSSNSPPPAPTATTTGPPPSASPSAGPATTTTGPPPSVSPTTSGSATTSALPPTSASPSGSAAPSVLSDPDGNQLALDAPFLTITSLDHATVRQDQTTWSLIITLGKDDGAVFSAWTEDHIGEQVAMVAGGRVVSAPQIQEAIPGREVVIAANYTRDEAENLLAAITGR